jgi:hypothetical protein
VVGSKSDRIIFGPYALRKRKQTGQIFIDFFCEKSRLLMNNMWC